jgi:UDP-galactopyranose mutase
MVHTYGPHIFHTQHRHVWEYVNRFGDMVPYNHRVKATTGDRVYSLPVNLLTINQFFGTTLSPEAAQRLIADKSDTRIVEPVSFEDQALKFVGRELYEAFFHGYTKKQWGVEPSELPASILARLPVRFSYEDSYFNHPWQASPRDGYTPIVQSILDHPRISLRLSTAFDRSQAGSFDHVVWTGPIDAFFDHLHGRLGYRTLDFDEQVHEGDFQGCPVMNYCDVDVPYTRITEHKHFAPWESHDKTVTYHEYSRLAGDGDVPYYPIRLVKEKEQLLRYVQEAQITPNVTFMGRLGTYRYLDMDVTIHEALDASARMLAALEAGTALPTFSVDPLG